MYKSIPLYLTQISIFGCKEYYINDDFMCIISSYICTQLIYFNLSLFDSHNKSTMSIYRVYQKKGNRNLQCSSAFIIQSTEIILSQAERPGFEHSIVIIFVKFEERLGKYESNEKSRSKSHIFTSEHF